MCWSLAEINLTAHTGYGLVNMDEDLYEMHGKSRMPAMPYSPQAKGFYSKLAESGPEGLSDKIKARYLNENNLRIFERLLTVSQKIGAPVSQVSLAWLMAHEFVTIPVVGCKNKTQLEDCMKSVGLCLDPQVRDFIIGKA
jgi:aryl-alcohol dehydrogenase-like predicted oxidoreductase